MIENNTECIKCDIKDIINNLLKRKINETVNSKEEETKFYNNILKIIEERFTYENYETSKLDN